MNLSQIDENVFNFSLPSLGKKTSPLLPRIHASIQIWPLSSIDTKYRLTSEGAARGWRFIMRSKNPAGSEPLEKATFANRAVVTLK